MNNIEKNEILSISKDLGEVAIDSLLNDGLFKDIPIIGTVLSVGNLVNSISDRILLSKLLHFINELNLKSSAEVDDFKQKYFKDNDYSKIGSRILLSLELADNLEKIRWLARTLRLFIEEELTKSEYLRLSSIINSVYVEDVLKINVFNLSEKITSTNNLNIESFVLEHLFSNGIISSCGFDGGDTSGENSGTVYFLNDFGLIIRDKII